MSPAVQKSPAISEESTSAFKNWINPAVVKRLGKAIAQVYPEFDERTFGRVSDQLSSFELKGRVRIIRDALKETLPESYKKSVSILVKAAELANLDGFELWPFSDFIATHGLTDPEISLEALKKLTPRFSSEFAVRPFLIRHPSLTLKFLKENLKCEDVHVRRWISEGSRSRLPWGERLPEFVRDPRGTIALIDKLKNDEELYVRKSVANHLNDVTKDNPELALNTLKQWVSEAEGSVHETKIAWITRHALRSLIKAGDARALALIGAKPPVQISVRDLELKVKTIRLGDSLSFHFELRSDARKSQKLVIDYVIHHRKANGETSAKVFKLKTLEMASGARIQITKNHSVKPITTRKYYAGLHHLEIQVNGQVMAEIEWNLKL